MATLPVCIGLMLLLDVPLLELFKITFAFKLVINMVPFKTSKYLADDLLNCL